MLNHTFNFPYISSDKYKLSEVIFYPKTPEIWDYLIVFQYQ